MGMIDERCNTNVVHPSITKNNFRSHRFKSVNMVQ